MQMGQAVAQDRSWQKMICDGALDFAHVPSTPVGLRGLAAVYTGLDGMYGDAVDVARFGEEGTGNRVNECWALRVLYIVFVSHVPPARPALGAGDAYLSARYAVSRGSK